jgi:uncharacterized protein YkwD
LFRHPSEGRDIAGSSFRIPPLRRRIGLVAAAAMVALTALGAHAAPAAATDTQAVMTQDTLAWINRDREAKGLTRYRPWAALNAIANERAASMASRDQLSHDAAGGDLGTTYDQRGIQWYGYGEIIGESNATYGRAAAAFTYRLWKASPPHAAILFSSHYNYIGIGFAYRASNGTTWASIVFADSKDHTPPLVARNGKRVSGRTVTFAWRGHDRVLQTRESGLGSFDVQYRVDSGAWRLIRNDTRATSITLRSRARGHWYGYRVRATDRRGNLSAWTSAGRVWVP